MRFIGLLAVLLGWSLLAQAESLDTVQVPVDGRGDAQRQDALAEGLEQMLVRLSVGSGMYSMRRWPVRRPRGWIVG